mmetsp:Transcript_10413/g.14707  ORF Transcript_10413/g.14707 Transcript_10413/m.14707 type:complete len:159 (-) Transcript_10413:242-718(-)
MVLCSCFEVDHSQSFPDDVVEMRDEDPQTSKKNINNETEIEINFNIESGAHIVQVMGTTLEDREEIDQMPESVVIIESEDKNRASRKNGYDQTDRYKCIRSCELDQTPLRPGRQQIDSNQSGPESAKDSMVRKSRHRIQLSRKVEKAPRRGRSNTKRT